MLTLAVPGDAVTAIILSVFYVHGLKPGPMFIRESISSFHAILIAGFIACIAMLVLGLWVAPKISKMIAVPKNILLPVVTVLCVVGAFACNNRLFDVGLMFLFGQFFSFTFSKKRKPAMAFTLQINMRIWIFLHGSRI